jgi:glycosyltransferase involved in cell wall biosynthesis
MKIAQIAPLYEAVPPRLHGGVGRMVAHLCDALVELGHEVTLFSSADARTKAELAPVREHALGDDAPDGGRSALAAHLSMLDEVRRHKDRFDIMHFHVDMAHFPFFEDKAGRTLTTIHGSLDTDALEEVYQRFAGYPLVSTSDWQRRGLPFANWVGTVHHGLPEHLYRPTAQSKGYLAFLGRMTPQKGADQAIAIARRLGMPLRLAGKRSRDDDGWFEAAVAPALDAPDIEFLGEIDDAAKAELLGGAAALLCPFEGREAFALTMIEAMACGTPVVAYDRGCAAELVDDGVSGVLVEDDVELAAQAVGRATSIDRTGVRRRFEQRFAATIMARRHLDLYADRLAFTPFAPELANDDGRADEEGESAASA